MPTDYVTPVKVNSSYNISDSGIYVCYQSLHSNWNTFFSRITSFDGKISLLDVGSCYHPFAEFEEFLPLGIDLCPAVEVIDYTATITHAIY